MRALVTGSQGFVGRYLRAELEENGYTVTGLDLVADDATLCVDLLDPAAVAQAVRQVVPDVVIHLAGQADVGLSWRQPQRTVQINVLGALNLMEAVRAHAPAAHLVLVGSSDQYGDLGAAGQSVDETLLTRPRSPYAVSKKAQEEMGAVYARAYGLHICMTRSFNHGGAGQREGFLIPDFAAGIARVEKGLAPDMAVGNLESQRDFTHVKDVVRAYRLLAEKGRPGEVYNVGSGATHSAREILDTLCAMARCSIPVRQDPARMRPSDTPVIRCDHTKLTEDTGWQPEIPLEQILHDALEDWRQRV